MARARSASASPGPWSKVWAVGSVVAAAAVGGRGARRAADVYGRLDKPRWAPPAGPFGPAWTVLYALNGIVGWRIRRPADRVVHTAQLALNAAWTPVFFGARDRGAALAIIVALDATVLAEMASLAKTDKKAAALLGPYLAWILYATALTASVSDPSTGAAAHGPARAEPRARDEET